MSSKVDFRPLVSSIQKIALYETKNKFFIVGSNNSQTRFRVLKLDRTEPHDLIIQDDGLEYSEKEVNQILLNGIKTKGSSATLPKPISAFGIVGFVKFLEGYYLILVTKRRQVASIGLHVIYKIEDTSLIAIPHESYRVPHHDEPRYLKMFQSIDLSSNFYFSYSYDITHSFQINTMTPKMEITSAGIDADKNGSHHLENTSICGIRYAPNRKFVWNNYLLSKIERKINSEWILYIMHGFIGQSNVSIFGRSVYVTLIARRSNRYAGTRFLKRGANHKGDVANEVETEQMVIDVGVSSNKNMHVSSFVQMRGSVPCQWSQDMTKMVAKPAITFDVSDPFYEIAGAHFNKLFRRYGSPIIILNLVKNREKKKHESQLSEQFNSAVSYLNLFLPPVHHIEYISFDMARMNKGKEAKVMDRLAKIAKSVISKTGFFVLNGPLVENKAMDRIKPGNNLQTGIIRVNCVDCLDRTNTAQFALGKCALAYQLYFLGLLDRPALEFDSDCVRLLEILYEDHGDTLALQYGGSQLVHRIKTYRKTAPWTSQGNDIMQTLSRYYRNTFSDAEKQDAINLFLGLYIPNEQKEPIWEQINDYYLHHPESVGELQPKKFPLTRWWDEDVLKCLPISYDCVNRQCLLIQPNLSLSAEYVDVYAHYHKTDRISVMDECYEFKISHSIRDFMPQCVTDFSPFTVRVRPGRMREETAKSGKNSNMKNPSLTGKSSTSSNTSTTSSGSDTDEDNESHQSFSRQYSMEHHVKPNEKSKDENVYGINEERFQIFEKDLELYKKYEKIGRYSRGHLINVHINELIKTKNISLEITVPFVGQETRNVYQKYVDKLSVDLVPDYIISRYKKYVNNDFENLNRLVV